MTKQRRSYSRGWRLFTVVILEPLLHALIKQEFQGREHFPRQGGLILAPNHLSYADWGTVALFSYESGRYPVFLIKSGVFNVKIVGSLLRKVGQLPVNRNQGDAALVLRDAERAIRDENACVIVYPEGTASRDPDLWPMRARTGVARLALATGAPVIPIAHWGAQDVLPYGSKKPSLFPRKTVRMVAGPPVDLSAFAGRPINTKTLREATDVIMADVAALLAGLRGGTPPAVPYDPAAHRRESMSRTDTEQAPASSDDATGGPPAEARPT
ncbi:MAG TPA: lysophospholipid acyltransferase family protein [Streptosporangiaceae bacterium]